MSGQDDETGDEDLVVVRRRWSAPEHTTVPRRALWDLHFRNEAGGVCSASPRAFLYAHVWCDRCASVELGHNCREGPPPHDLAVCILPGDNAAPVYDRLVGRLGR